MGPYLPDRREAVSLFYDWTRRLAASGMLDVLSIGTSQLSQSRFGDDWGNAPNGGGVPIALPEEYEEAWKAARPMLVRTYSGTRNVEALARMYEERLDIAWHALSFWWFCGLDGRGPNSVADNLAEHHAARADHRRFRQALRTERSAPLRVPGRRRRLLRGFRISGRPGGQGRRHKAAGSPDHAQHAKIDLGHPGPGEGPGPAFPRPLPEGPDFRVALQPRGGLDYFSKDIEKAKAHWLPSPP
jgi:hypothetical protein